MIFFEPLSEFVIGGKKAFAVLNPSKCQNFKHLVGSVVDVGGKKFTVTGVEAFMHAPPWRTGEKIAIRVEPADA